MGISVFLSYPNPHTCVQQTFVAQLREYLEARGFAPRTLGVTDYDVDAPLTAIRRLMLESNGLITVALRRTFVERGASRHAADVPRTLPASVDGKWLTSPWSQIEPAMAYQLGLPILILREKGVLEEGVLERGVVGQYMPEFDLETPADYFRSTEWNGMIGRWEGYVRSVVSAKGKPPSLY
jgi:hypothetical protein